MALWVEWLIKLQDSSVEETNNSNYEYIRIIIRKILSEDLGSVKGVGATGYGTAGGFIVGADRPMLGTVEVEDKGVMPNMTPVKVSRAFTKKLKLEDSDLS